MRPTAAWAILAAMHTLPAAAQPGSAVTDPAPSSGEAVVLREPLKPGDPAPALSVDSWFKGEMVSGFEPGRVYVVEFWATWCGPCIDSIPHLTHLQHQYKDRVRIIGVSTDSRRDDAERFVEEQGDAMDYAVAHDADRSMTDDWMRAAGRNGIPCSFVVDGRGRMVWVGHPRFGLDPVLERVVKGDFDAGAWAEAESRFFQLVQRSVEAARAGDDAAAGAALDDAAKIDAYFASQAALMRFRIEINIRQRFDEALRMAAGLIDGVHKDDASALAQIGSEIMDAPGPSSRDVSLAIRALQRAVEIEKGRDPGTLARLARAHWRNGDVARAAEVQQRALEATRGERRRVQAHNVLEQYQSGK